MAFSFITTVFNEENSIKNLLDSLLEQKVKPKEIVIVDAGSKDKTVDIIKSYSKKLPIRLIIKKGNRSMGRNMAIKMAKSEIVAVSDADCVLKKDWFEKITSPFEAVRADVVAGYYRPIVENMFQKCLAAYTCFPEDKIDDNFLPSSRSIAFRKSAWEKVRGYPEDLNTCEDLVFAKKLKDKSLRFYVEKKAVVMWPQRKNLVEAFRQFFLYAKGDGHAFYIRPQTPVLFGRYLFLVLLVFSYIYTHSRQIMYFIAALFFLYVVWSISKNYRYVKDVRALFFLPVLQLVSDVAVMMGFIVGLLKSYKS